jgi:hypothetical protein
MGEGSRDVRIPFSSYDVFGFLIPGASLFAGSYLFEHALRRVSLSFDTPLWTMVHWPGPLEKPTVVVVSCAVMFVLAAFVAGHVITTISKHFIESLLVSKGYGWPYEFLLKLAPPKKRNEYWLAFHRGLFFWLVVYLTLRYVALFLWHWRPLNVAATIAGWLIVVVVLWKVVARSFRLDLVKVVEKSTVGRGVLRVVMLWLWARPYDAIAKMLGDYLGTREPFNRAFRERYLLEFKAATGLDARGAGTGNFWLTRFYVAQHSPRLDGTLNSWYQRIGYARNLAVAFFGIFLYAFVSLTSQRALVQRVAVHDDFLWMPLVSLLLGLCMIVRYYYLFVVLFTKGVFRSFILLRGAQETQPRRSNPPPP